jgi:hypothetical protein
MEGHEDGDLIMLDGREKKGPQSDETPELPESVANSPLFELPREIRERIYAICLSYSDGAHTAVEWPRCPLDSDHYGLQPQLLRTCKIISEEATPHLYTLNNLTFHHPSDANVFVRAFSSPIFGRQIAKLSLNIRTSDTRMWMPYLTSTDEVRSLRADFPNLKELGVRFRSNKWNARESPEVNLKTWCDDNRLDEVLDGLRHAFFPKSSDREFGEKETQEYFERHQPVIRDAREERRFRDRLLELHKARLDRSRQRRAETPIIRCCVACRVHPAHFDALVMPAVSADASGASSQPVVEGEEFRGFTPADLRKGVRRLYDPEIGSANVSRTPYTLRNGVLVALEIHCIDLKKDNNEDAT